MMKNHRGFTLIELLVVIAIIGILSSVVLASLNSARSKSRDARRISDIKQLQLALELYFDDNSEYPTALNSIGNEYIGNVPTDPLDSGSDSGNYWYYRDTTTSYHLGATLESSDNSALDGDADHDSGTSGFDGADPIYDITS